MFRTQIDRINHSLNILRVLRVLRSLRALRVLRTIRFIQSLHTIVKTCSKALPAMASITFVMIIITCISAIVARNLFGDICPEKFSNLVKTFFSLFTLLTLDDWYSVYQTCSEREFSNFLLIFCLIYILIINFILLNILMAVLVDSFQDTLGCDTKRYSPLYKVEKAEERTKNNLACLMEEFCNDIEFHGVESNSSLNQSIQDINQQNNLSRDYQQNQSQVRIEKLVKHYYLLIEQLEYRMERHEQLTKLVQRSIKFTLIDRDVRKNSLKKQLLR